VTDIFLSYAREDSNCAVAMIQAFKHAGWSVWFDRSIPPAGEWMGILETELEQARCVVMLWSDHAMQSDWVLKEGMAGLDRAVLIPVRIREADVPEVFASIQFADLTSWDGDQDAPAFADLLQSIRRQILPDCRVRFESIFNPRLEDLENLYQAFLQVTGRLGFMPAPGRFQPPSTHDERRRLHRTVASLQVSIEWDSVLANWFVGSPARKILLDEVRRIERHVPLIWLRLLSYSGPFFSSGSSPQSHASFLRFASLRFFHQMFGALRSMGQHVERPPQLTNAQLSFPRWEGAISALFEDPDDTAEAYVTQFDDSPLGTEEVFYAPKHRSQIAYGRSLRKFPFTEPVWLERYVVPQRELRFALEGSAQHTVYGGNARIRKLVDLKGNDLPPLYDV
jgi:hypothetical protein